MSKQALDKHTNTTISYKPQITSVTDYYAIGSQINERTYDPVKPLYRFGFNTQEKVNEISPDHYTAKYWEYDARLGRRWNVDPKPQTEWSWYSVLNSNPILLTDWQGDIPPELIVREGKITSSFAPRVHPITKEIKVHRALDIASSIGENVHAYAGGKVVYVGFQYNKEKKTGWGHYVVIEHQKGIYSLYAHLSEPLVKEGDIVQNDQVIAKTGATGGVTGPHLHLEVGLAKNLSEFLDTRKRSETRIDPLILGDLEEQLKKNIDIREYLKISQNKVQKSNNTNNNAKLQKGTNDENKK